MGAVKGFKKMFGGAIGWVKGKSEKGKQFVKDKATAAKEWGAGKVQGIKDRLTGKGDEEEAGAEAAPAPASATREDARGERRAAQQCPCRGLAKRIPEEVEDPEEVQRAVQAVYGELGPKGLKSIDVRQVENEPGIFDVYVAASPDEVEHRFRVQDFQLASSVPTALLAKIGGREPIRFQSNPDGHAEQNFMDNVWDSIDLIKKEFPPGTPDAPAPLPIRLDITRSPCKKFCAPQLNRFKTDMLKEGYDVDLEIRVASVYTPKEKSQPGGREGSIKALENLRKKGVKVSVLTLNDVVFDESAGDGLDDEEVDEATEKNKVMATIIKERLAKFDSIHAGTKFSSADRRATDKQKRDAATIIEVLEKAGWTNARDGDLIAAGGTCATPATLPSSRPSTKCARTSSTSRSVTRAARAGSGCGFRTSAGSASCSSSSSRCRTRSMPRTTRSTSGRS